MHKITVKNKYRASTTNVKTRLVYLRVEMRY